MPVSMAFKDEINYEKISQINKKERKTSKLTNLDPEFYFALISHLNILQEEYNKKHSENPTSTEALLLNNEICKLDGIIKEIYNRRERKILLSALDHGAKIDVRNMLKHEQKLYSTIINLLKEYRSEILSQKPNLVCDKPDEKMGFDSEEIPQEIETELESNTSIENNITELSSEPGEEYTEPSKLNVTGEDEKDQTKIEGSEISDKEVTEAEGSEQVLVHVKEDIEPFVGPDLVTYTLHKEDLATIPKTIAEILIRNNKVSIVEPSI
jgi:DNA replication initiation complex subunit (GINS family)